MIQEKIVIGEGTEYPLEGLLTLPSLGGVSKPAVVLVQGSGASDMDERIKGIRPFRDIAEGLAQRGIAAIRYNKRSYSYGRKMMKKLKSSFTVREETVEDAVLAANLLRDDPRIDSTNIYIAGHSLGGMLAPRIDTEGVVSTATIRDGYWDGSTGNFAGLIIMAGSPRKLEDIMKQQQEDYLKTAKGLTGWIMKKRIEKFAAKLSDIPNLTDEEAKEVSFAGNTSLYYLKEMGDWPTLDYLRESIKPIFVIQGEKDLQVLVEEDFNEYRQLLANNPNASFKLYEGLNHAFMPSLTDDIGKVMKEFKVERPVEDYVIDDIADWVLKQAEIKMPKI
ncbi:MAG: alpha/beta hydrolase [Coriobacteriia bacterium]|nr:alpha/beta hydrolase [Coriobacteriia bacterium]MCL2870365.1 alpha/beta hydrolase [Coriobacteriia bacterium]